LNVRRPERHPALVGDENSRMFYTEIKNAPRRFENEFEPKVKIHFQTQGLGAYQTAEPPTYISCAEMPDVVFSKDFYV
jgi:hypothetical protein